MVYLPHWLFRIEGDFTEGVNVIEHWSNGFRLKDNGEFPFDPRAWLLAHGAVAASTLYATNLVASSVKVAALKLNEIGPDGRYLDKEDTTVVYPGEFSPIAGQSSSYVEPQRTIAISLTTGYSRGPAHRGRIFLPGFVGNVGPSLGVGTGTLDPLALSAKAALLEMNEDPALDVVIASKIGQGHLKFVTGVEVGNRVDTQRRRRRSLPESYTAVSLS